MTSPRSSIPILTEYASMFTSCRGPNGRIQTIATGKGIHVEFTSSSRRLFSLLPAEESPFLKMIKAGVSAHLDNFHDGGLFVAAFSSSLLAKGLQSDLARHGLVVILEQIRADVLDFFNCDDRQWVVQLDLGNSKMMLSIAKAILNTKPVCRLLSRDREMLAVLILKAFLATLPGNLSHYSPLERIRIFPLVGATSESSEYFPGVVLQVPLQNQDIFTAVRRKKRAGLNLSVALFSTSLAGDIEEWVSGDLTVEEMSEDTVVRHLLDLADELERLGIDVLFCQKCVHPKMKLHLQKKGILTFHRVSGQHIGAVRNICNAELIKTTDLPIESRSLGKLEDLVYLERQSKSFLHLVSSAATPLPVSTIILCAPDDTAMEELEIVAHQAIFNFFNLIRKPQLVKGAGAFERQLAEHLKENTPTKETLNTLKVTRSQYLIGSNVFLASLLSTVRQLGDEERDDVLDCVSVKQNALLSGLDLAITGLRVVNIINPTT